VLKIIPFIIVMAFMSVANAADSPKQLTGDDLKTAIEMNKVYAQHMYSSSCFERQKAYQTVFGMPEAEKAKLLFDIKKSCDCMTDLVVKNAMPNDVINFVMVTNGSALPNAKENNVNNIETQKMAKIMAIGLNENNRKNCGFKQQ